MNKVNTDKEEIKYLTIEDLKKMFEESEPNNCDVVSYPINFHPKHNTKINEGRSSYVDTPMCFTMRDIKDYMPEDHAKFFLDYYNLFDGNEPYQDKRGPYRDKLLNELYYNVYENGLQSSNGNIPHTFFNGKTIRFLDKDQKIEKLKKSFDIFKRLKERDLVLASMYVPHRCNYAYATNQIEYSDYDQNENTHLYLLRERALIHYILYLFDPMHIQAYLYIRNNFPNIKITENMMPQHLMYKGR